jgi:antagonist of KipI
MMSLEVVKPGALSSFQDLGRWGYQRFGVPVNGVMDERAHRIANWLVGNPAGEATLEITLTGPTLKFRARAEIAICGADLAAAIDGHRVPHAARMVIDRGGVLSFGARGAAEQAGIRACIAVRGGYALDREMCSASTNVRGGYGGLHGAPLRKGALIKLRGATKRTAPTARLPILSPEILRTADAPIRMVAGREAASFTDEARAVFAGADWRISNQSDRMGYRLQGPVLARSDKRELLSEGVGFGTVQVPPDGQPIVLMADRQTAGGYPRIAQVAWVDLPRIAQKGPGETLLFEWIELAEAQRLAVMQERIFERMEQDHG